MSLPASPLFVDQGVDWTTGLKHFYSTPTIAKVERLRKDGWFPVASHGCSKEFCLRAENVVCG